MGLIPKELYLNIKQLNNLRNTYSHEIDYSFKNFNFSVFFNPDNINRRKIIL